MALISANFRSHQIVKEWTVNDEQPEYRIRFQWLRSLWRKRQGSFHNDHKTIDITRTLIQRNSFDVYELGTVWYNKLLMINS